MGAPEAWAACAVGAVVLLVVVCLGWLFRARHNERVIAGAILDMHAALAEGPAPQRSLLSKVADTLAAQEREAAKIQLALQEIVPGETALPEPEALLKDLLDLPEPQLLLIEFLEHYAGSSDSDAAFVSVAAGLLRAAIIKVFGDLADDRAPELERLLLLGVEGRITPVALAGVGTDADPGALAERAPGVADLDPRAISAIVEALQFTTRRQLRLATLLHGQGEAILRLRQSDRHGLAAMIERLALLLKFPPVARPAFGPAELRALVVAFDAVGEVIDTATERLSEGEPLPAAHLLAGVRVPVPPGLPGRMYHQDMLAQVRPLAALAVWHRLAVSRWTGLALLALISEGTAVPVYSGSSAGWPATRPRRRCETGG
jgi:hypothetical protein